MSRESVDIHPHLIPRYREMAKSAQRRTPEVPGPILSAAGYLTPQLIPREEAKT